MYLKNIFKKTRKPRESGHYWVRWSGLVSGIPASPVNWRMGAYVQHIGWKLPGDERLYQDGDFLEINEARIPFTTGQLYPGFWVWVVTVAYIVAAAIYIYLIFNELYK